MEASSLEIGSHVWVQENEGYVWSQGIVRGIQKESGKVSVAIKGANNEKSFSVSNVLPCNIPEVDGASNLLSLEYLHDPAVMHNLRLRFQKDQIYTWAGQILISINPFKQLPIMGPDFFVKYKDCHQLTDDDASSIDPHVYAVADRAYGGMRNKGPQSTLISGESGAGKTEAAKAVLMYVTQQGAQHAATSSSSSSSSLAQRIMDSNPILEAFGNAKTCRNDNSSRFGKYIQVNFDSDGGVCGADTIQYLLEKVRVVKQQEGERSYHVFYQLLASASHDSELSSKLKLRGNPTDHFYLQQSGVTTIKGVDDRKEWSEVVRAWTTLGFTAEMRSAVTQVLAGILHLGDIKFSPTGGGGDDGSKVTNPEKIAHVTSMLNIDAELLVQALTFRSITAGGSTMHKPLTPELAAVARDSLAKAIYNNMFIWTVDCINKYTAGTGAGSSSIGILDIFGFEIFQQNSFEQLCINYCNESLQQHFNNFIFKSEQRDYEEEKIDVSKIVFEDNQDCLDLIEKAPDGILPSIDDVFKTPKATDITLIERLNKVHSSHPKFGKSKMNRDSFTVTHFAGNVSYNVTGFLDKNVDALNLDLKAVLNSCHDDVIANITCEKDSSAGAAAGPSSPVTGFASPSSPSLMSIGGGKRPAVLSIGQQFRMQLKSLMTRLNTTDPHFIKCIKSSSVKLPDSWENDLISRQLRFSGVLEATRIRRSGFPVRTKYHLFVDRYYLLVKGATPKDEPRSLTSKILASQEDKDGFAMGTTKVFLREKLASKLDAQRTAVRRMAVQEIQRLAKPILYRKRMKKMLVEGPKLTCSARAHVARQAYRRRLMNLSAEDQEILQALDPVPPRPPTPIVVEESPEEKVQKAKSLVEDRRPDLAAKWWWVGWENSNNIGDGEENNNNEDAFFKNNNNNNNGSNPSPPPHPPLDVEQVVVRLFDELESAEVMQDTLSLQMKDMNEKFENERMQQQKVVSELNDKAQHLESEVKLRDDVIEELHQELEEMKQSSKAEEKEIRKQLEDAKAEMMVNSRAQEKAMQMELQEHCELIEALDEELKIREAEIENWSQRHAAAFAEWQEEKSSALGSMDTLRERLRQAESTIAQAEAENIELKESVLRYYEIAEKSKLAEIESRRQVSEAQYALAAAGVLHPQSQSQSQFSSSKGKNMTTTMMKNSGGAFAPKLDSSLLFPPFRDDPVLASSSSSSFLGSGGMTTMIMGSGAQRMPMFPMSVETHAQALSGLEEARKQVEEKRVDLRMRIFQFIAGRNRKYQLKKIVSSWKHICHWSAHGNALLRMDDTTSLSPLRLIGKKYTQGQEKWGWKLLRRFFFQWYRGVWSEQVWVERRSVKQTAAEEELVEAKEMWLMQLHTIRKEREGLSEQLMVCKQQIAEKTAEIEQLEQQLNAALDQIARQESAMVETIEKVNQREEQLQRTTIASKSFKDRENALLDELNRLKATVVRKEDLIEEMRGELEQRHLAILKAKDAASAASARSAQFAIVNEERLQLIDNLQRLQQVLAAYQGRRLTVWTQFAASRNRRKTLADIWKRWLEAMRLLRYRKKVEVQSTVHFARKGLHQFHLQIRMRQIRQLIKQLEQCQARSDVFEGRWKEMEHKVDVLQREAALGIAAKTEQRRAESALKSAQAAKDSLSEMLTESNGQLQVAEVSVQKMQEKLDKAASSNKSLRKVATKQALQQQQKSYDRLISRRMRLEKWDAFHAWKRVLQLVASREVGLRNLANRQKIAFIRRTFIAWLRAGASSTASFGNRRDSLGDGTILKKDSSTPILSQSFGETNNGKNNNNHHHLRPSPFATSILAATATPTMNGSNTTVPTAGAASNSIMHRGYGNTSALSLSQQHLSNGNTMMMKLLASSPMRTTTRAMSPPTIRGGE